MTQGCLIFSYDGEIDYGSQAVVAAALVNKNLGIPVSLVTNKNTLENIESKFKKLPFDQILINEPLDDENKRILTNETGRRKKISFINGNRYTAWYITPYDETLVIDSDFLVLSNSLNRFWNSKYSFLITPGALDLNSHMGPTEYFLSSYSIKQLWATVIMFKKDEESKLLFDLAQHIKDNYSYYGELYYFDAGQFRNDFAFSIACHVLSGMGQDRWYGELPIPLLIKDVDDICTVRSDQITYLLKDYSKIENFLLCRSKGQDAHVMNKCSILNKLPELLTIADFVNE